MLQSLRLSPRSMSRRCLSTRRSDPTTSSALRTAVQIAEAPSVEPRPHPGAVSKEVGFTTRLSDGRGQLRQDSITVGKGDWPRPKAEGSASPCVGRPRRRLSVGLLLLSLAYSETLRPPPLAHLSHRTI